VLNRERHPRPRFSARLFDKDCVARGVPLYDPNITSPVKMTSTSSSTTETGSGGSWALNARPGDRAADVRACHTGIKNLVLAGDETALPAIARIAAAAFRGKVSISAESEDGQRNSHLFTAANHELRGFNRMPACSTTAQLERALRCMSEKYPSALFWQPATSKALAKSATS